MNTPHPKCFPTFTIFREWVSLAKVAKEKISPCEDCTLSYEMQMKHLKRCDRNWVETNLVIGGKTLNIGTL